MQRTVENEWLDELSPDSTGARRSRLDLRRLNGILGHARLLATVLSPRIQRADRPRLADLGAGDGAFSLSLARRLPRPRAGGVFILIDKQMVFDARLGSAFAALGWDLQFREINAFDWLESNEPGPLDAVVANLFLHHFRDDRLARLFTGIATHSSWFAACETRRNPFSLAASRLVGLIGCRAITRHDAVVSVRSGFSGDELTRLWPGRMDWSLQEHPLGWCSHWFMARRTS